MQYRMDAKSGDKLSCLGMGGMRFPQALGRIDMPKTERLVMRAVEAGVNYFDTAYLYGGSEEALGAIFANNGVRAKVKLATKLPLAIIRSGDDFERYFQRQLGRLQTDYVDYYLMHMVTDMDQWQRLCAWGVEDWLREKKASGAIRRVGFSFHGIRDEFMKVLDAYDWELCQIQYNYSDENFQAGVAGLRRAAEKGIPVVVMEPLLGGKLATGLPKQAVARFAQADPAYTPAQWALRWLWNQPEVTVVLSGMGDEGQLEENLAAAEDAAPGMLSPEALAVFTEVKAVLAANSRVGCTGCGYCLPCPHNVNIPACFSAYNASYNMSYYTGLQQYATSTGPLSAVRSTASRCVGCGVCVKKCPQGVAIPQELKKVQSRLEPFWYRWGTGAARAFLGRHAPK